MKALIDGDVLIYRVGYASDNTNERNAVARLKQSVKGILEATGCNDYEIFLSDSIRNNYRYEIFPLYKANRTLPKPRHYECLSNTFVEQFEATVSYGMEADDGIGIAATELGEEAVIVSIDKDLLQIPGEHFNYVTGVRRTVTPTEGLFRFYKQILTGDTTDNITGAVGLGCPGIGERRANRLLETASSVEDYGSIIWQAYNRRLKDYDNTELHTRIEVTGQLVKIRTQPDELWRYDYNV